MNKLPEVKQFINGDLESKFERTEYKKIPGKSPEIVFFNEAGTELERINIEKFSREELNKMMIEKGFPSKKIEHDEV